MIEVSPVGVVRTPDAADQAVQFPVLPHDGGAKRMFEPLMSSINAPDAGPVQ
jgi:hypothetical protein